MAMMKKFEVFILQDQVTLSMYNLDKSIEDFARSCLNYGLIKKWPVYLSLKIQFKKWEVV